MNAGTERPRPHPFSVRTSKRENRPGAWNSTVVEIFMDGVRIGGYVRNYPGHAEATFEPFMLEGRWYALYSPDYTTTRVMSLPECADIGGEERDACGFCPVELYVPAYRLFGFDMRHDHRAGQRVEPHVERHHTVLWPWEASDIAEAEARIAREAAEGPGAPPSPSFNYDLTDWRWCPFGFVAGCVWGDDSSWKIEMLDLSRAAEGVLSRKARFGYVEMPTAMRLREAVDLSLWRPGFDRVGVSHTQWWDLDGDGGPL